MFDDLYARSPSVFAYQGCLNQPGDILVEELWNSSKALTTAIAQSATNKNILILTGASQEEIRLFHDLAYFAECPILDFPSWETLPSENIPPSPDIVGDRYSVLQKLQSSHAPLIVISSLQACLQRLLDPSLFSSLHLDLKIGQQQAFESLIEKLLKMGYQRKPVASDKGEFALRGGIMDVFPVNSPDPYRLEFWGDELESIRIYDPIGQKSMRTVEGVEILPAQEMELLQRQEKNATILDYLNANTLLIFDDLLALEDRYSTLIGMGDKNPYFLSIEEFFDKISGYQKILWSNKPIEELSHVEGNRRENYYSKQVPFHPLSFEMFNRKWAVKRWNHPFSTLQQYLCSEEEDPTGEELLERLARLPADYTLQFLCSSETEEHNLRQKIENTPLKLPEKTSFHQNYLSTGLVIGDSRTVLFPTTEWTHRYKIRRQKIRSNYHTTLAENCELTPGDIVVHLNNGIGRFCGLEKRPNHLGVASEFFLIEYSEGSKLYVPMNQAHLLTKYIGSHEESPKLSTLGNSKWKKTKEQTERAILGYAADLLKNYAQRAFKEGIAYPPDQDEVREFEEEFPFDETEDQLAAVSEIKKDLESTKVMDRLVCGDVGYGKTEVAMRTAFKAVVDGKKQVAVLVPTTILAMQHYDNFVERMRHFPINIGVLSRFRSQKEIKETLQGLEKGAIDIVVGTHRLISQDVKFKDLGLVIIDEEQRFGVRAKEHLKQMKIGVDCLTLSATPIPRTLYLSLIGARDMSVINTPPHDRLPIKTVMTESSDQLIKTAILRELARDGQVFFIHNRVETIYSVAAYLKELLPQLRVLVAHGQLSTDEIDSTFHAFKQGKADVLVATTLVENGIDIPNANTILIDRADCFGLATLYQLRGRVGRWNRRAYAYFLVPSLVSLPEISRKRLQALAEASGYGAGMKLAMRDLEIRGAGDILGTEQSGQVSAIGFHLYCKLLKRSIRALQGQESSILSDPKIDLAIDARLPEEYVNEVSLRMELYQRLGEATSLEEVDLLWLEVLDRFGPAPEPADWLYHLTRVRVEASRCGVTLLKQEKMSLTIEKQVGKTNSVRKILMKFKNPKEMEKKILEALSI